MSTIRTAGNSGVELTRQLLGRGMSRAEISRLARSGYLDHLRRGAYAHPTSTDEGDEVQDREKHRKLIMATVPQLGEPAWVSHTSAALMRSLPVWSKRLSRVHVTRPRQSGQGRISRYVHVHSAPLPDVHLDDINGLPVTSLERTVIDATRMLPFREGLALTDAALRLGAEDSALTSVLSTLGRRQGVAMTRSVLEFADTLSESVGESYSRVLMADQELPRPELQRKIFDHTGAFVARPDFCWEEYCTVAEFDGKIKYGRALKPGQSIEEVVYAEKLREDALRDLGWQVARWTWTDLSTPDVIVDRLRRAFARGTD